MVETLEKQEAKELEAHDELGIIPKAIANIQQKCDKPNPFDTASMFSRESYCFLGDLMSLGYKKPLEASDMYKCVEEDDAELLTQQLKDVWQKEIETGKPSLMRALCSMFWYENLTTFFIGLVEWSAAVAEPYFISELLILFSKDDDDEEVSTDDMWMYAGLYLACSLTRVLLHHPYFYRAQHIGMRMRIACVGLVYEKVLSLSNKSLSQTTTGHLVNLVSNDTERFDQTTPFFHFLIIGPLKLIAITYFMYSKMGPSTFAGVGFCILLAPLQFLMGKTFAKLRQLSASWTDKRVKYMNELITGVRLIKMYAWEKPFSDTILGIRVQEAAKLQMTANLRAFNAGFFFVSTPLIMFIILSIYVHTTDDDLTPSKVFSVMMYINVLRISVSLFIPEAIKNGSECLVSISRLQNFLLKEEYSAYDVVKPMEGSTTIEFANVTAGWTETPVLKNASLNVKEGELLGVTGVVGAGKTSLLSTIIGELPVSEGSISVKCRPTLAEQEVWISSETVRVNILFGREFNEDRYNRVVDACCLYPDFEQFTNGDQTMIGERGITLSGGQRARISLARACYQGGDIYLLDDPLSAVDTIVGRHIFDKCINGILKNKTRILVTHQHQFLPSCDRVIEIADQKVNVKDVSDIVVEEVAEDKRATEEAKQVTDSSSPQEDLSKEDRMTGSVSLASYVSYFQNGGVASSILFVILAFAAQTMFVLNDVWLSRWTDRPANDQDSQYHYRVYIVSISILVVLGFIRAGLFFKLALTSSTNLHNKMFKALIRSPVGFFDTNPSGRVLNRFSKDLGQMDELLPWIFFDCVQQSMLVLGSVVIVVVVNYWVMVIVLPLVIVFGFLRSYFVATAREVKRLEANARSPLYSMFSEGISGLHTIRAFGKSKFFLSRYKAAQNDHNSAFFLFLACNRWIGLRLDTMSWVFITTVTITAVLARNQMSSGDAALSLTYATALAGSFQWCVRQSAETENNMTACERVRTYGDLTPEAPAETKPEVNLPPSWPAEGSIEFKEYSLRYREGLPEVLKKVSCKIEAGSNVGVVGRTGAGKSSLMQALFRLVEPSHGTIVIDGIDCQDLGLHDLRSRCSVIPQDPILFSGTLRYNLDPFDMVETDRVLWKALEDVQLKSTVEELNGKLDFEVSEGGKNFSVGQRQLVCLARALLRKNKILMMDEATANVDPETDKVIQETVRRSFENCTVLTIAHRLHTVIDSDMILVLSGGQVAAFGDPHELLQDEDNLLTKFVNQTGMEASMSLKEAARVASYRRSPKHNTTSPY